MRIRDLKNQQFNRLTVSETYEVRNNAKYWLCKCTCGNDVFVKTSKLINSHTQSCGCLQKDRASEYCKQNKPIHRDCGTKGYSSYRNMLNRCCNPKHDKYKYYGARGITIDPTWLGPDGYNQFIKDMGQPGVAMSLDRKDVNGGYSKDNCKWATKIEQMRNMRSNRVINTSQGDKCLAQVCEELFIKPGDIHNLVKRKGMTYEEAINYLR